MHSIWVPVFPVPERRAVNEEEVALYGLSVKMAATVMQNLTKESGKTKKRERSEIRDIQEPQCYTHMLRSVVTLSCYTQMLHSNVTCKCYIHMLHSNLTLKCHTQKRKIRDIHFLSSIYSVLLPKAIMPHTYGLSEYHIYTLCTSAAQPRFVPATRPFGNTEDWN